MSKVYIKSYGKVDKVIIDLSNINVKRKEYLNKLKGHNQIMSYLAWNYLKEIVLKELKLDIDKLNLTYNEYGKPLFDEFCFNISHSQNVIAIAISSKDIGIDIQCLDVNDTFLLAKKMNMENNPKEVIERFSKIEAHGKKIGKGINMSSFQKTPEISLLKRLNIENKEFVLSVDSEEAIELVKINK